ncbi:MAG TPA: pilin [Candidatus Paceibacterota bacterium]
MKLYIKKIPATAIFIVLCIIFSSLSILIIPAFIGISEISPFSATLVMAQERVLSPGDQLGYDGLVDCDGVLTKQGEPGYEPGRQRICDFNALMGTINKIINWMFAISIPVAVTLFSYAGILYMKGTQADRTKANKIFTDVGIGFIIMLTAWFGVRTVVDWFVENNSSATSLLGK